MKLAYTNWHKEVVHDDAIQSELSSLSKGQLEFTNTPYVKDFRPGNDNNRDRGYGDFRNNRNQKFKRNGGNNRGNDNRGGQGQGGGNRNNNNNKFKKRFK